MRPRGLALFVAPQILSGKRVLIVEDELLVALLVEEFLLDFGCTPAALCSNVAEALEALESGAFDLAVLDVNLGGERSYPIADALATRGIPFLFVSGYGNEAMPSDHSDWKVCAKPFTENDLATMLSTVLHEACLPEPAGR